MLAPSILLVESSRATILALNSGPVCKVPVPTTAWHHIPETAYAQFFQKIANVWCDSILLAT